MLIEKDEDAEQRRVDQQRSISDGEEGRAGESGFAIPQAADGDSEEGRKGPVGQVYFIETEDGKFVKIGYSTRPYRRLSQLGTLRPGNYALRLVGWLPGTIETERWLHAKFSADRDNGEWFRDSAQLRQFIAALGLIQPEPEPKPEPQPVQPEAEPAADLVAETTVNERWALVDVSKAGRAGGKARAENLTDAQLSAGASLAARVRWDAYYEAHPEKLTAKQEREARRKTKRGKRAK